MSKIRSDLTKQGFIKYLEEHPDERFWQSVRNFSGYSFVLVSNVLPDNKDIADTFYWEDIVEPEKEGL